MLASRSGFAALLWKSELSTTLFMGMRLQQRHCLQIRRKLWTFVLRNSALFAVKLRIIDCFSHLLMKWTRNTPWFCTTLEWGGCQVDACCLESLNWEEKFSFSVKGNTNWSYTWRNQILSDTFPVGWHLFSTFWTQLFLQGSWPSIVNAREKLAEFKAKPVLWKNRVEMRKLLNCPCLEETFKYFLTHLQTFLPKFSNISDAAYLVWWLRLASIIASLQ